MTQVIALETLTQAAFAAFGELINTFTRHSVLTALAAPGLFAVIARTGEGPNLKEHWFDTPYSVEPVTELASAGLVEG